MNCHSFMITLLFTMSAISCSDMIQGSRSNVFPLLSYSTQCPVPTSAMNTYLDLTGPSEIGAVNVSMDCHFLYVGGQSPNIYKISIATNEITYAPIPNRTQRSVLVGKYLWTVEGMAQPKGSCALQKIDTETLDVVWLEETILDDARAITYDGRYIWCADMGLSRMLHRVDPKTHEITSYPGIVLEGARYLLFDGRWLWITCNTASALVRINPSDRSFSVMNGIVNAWGICQYGNSLIVAGSTGNIYKIDPSNLSIIDSTSIPSSYQCHCSYDGRYVWVIQRASSTVRVVDPETLETITIMSTSPGIPHMSIPDGYFQWILNDSHPRLLKLRL